MHHAMGSPRERAGERAPRAHAGAPALAFAVRPVALAGCDAGPCSGHGAGGPLRLGGFGVELALKNMEYKAMDEKVRACVRSV